VTGVEFRLSTSKLPDGTYVCRLLVIARRGELPESISENLTTWWLGLAQKQTSENGVALLDCMIATSDEFTMNEYLSSVLLDDRFLGEDYDVA